MQEDSTQCSFVEWFDDPWPRRCQRYIKDLCHAAAATARGLSWAAESRLEAVRHRDQAVRRLDNAEREREELERDMARIIMEKDEEVQNARRLSQRWMVATLSVSLMLLVLLFFQSKN